MRNSGPLEELLYRGRENRENSVSLILYAVVLLNFVDDKILDPFKIRTTYVSA